MQDSKAQIVKTIENIHGHTDAAYASLCRTAGLAQATFWRWKQRVERDEPVVRRPGPKKTGVPDWEKLEATIRQLAHGRKRTRGTGALYDEVRDTMSRRELGAMVAEVRRELNDTRAAAMHHIDWCSPGLVWAMDPSELPRDRVYGRIEGLTVQDLGSQYKFDPIAGAVPCGEEVAGHLERLFTQFGAPLFMKRDNGGNLNHPAVNAVLDRHWVIPVNSPCAYPQYNGGVEHAQGEMQEAFERRLGQCDRCPPEHAEAYLAAAMHDRNHSPRRALGNKTSCSVFTSVRNRGRINRRQRKEVTDQLIHATVAIVEQIEPVNGRTIQTAWRVAVQQWLVAHDAIRVSTRNGVSPTSQSQSLS